MCQIAGCTLNVGQVGLASLRVADKIRIGLNGTPCFHACPQLVILLTPFQLAGIKSLRVEVKINVLTLQLDMAKSPWASICSASRIRCIYLTHIVKLSWNMFRAPVGRHKVCS